MHNRKIAGQAEIINEVEAGCTVQVIELQKEFCSEIQSDAFAI